MKKYMLILVAILLCLSQNEVNGQDIKEELKKMYERLATADRIQLKASVKVYLPGDFQLPVSIQEAEVNKDNFNALVKMGKSTFLQNEVFLLMVDDEEKEITFQQLDPEDVEANESAVEKRRNKFNEDKLIAPLDSFISRCDTIIYMGMEDEMKGYLVRFEGNYLKTIEVTFDSQNMLRQIIYNYNPTLENTYGRVEITYDKMSLSPVFSDDFFSEGKYLLYVNGRYQPTAAYKGYEVYDNADYIE